MNENNRKAISWVAVVVAVAAIVFLVYAITTLKVTAPADNDSISVTRQPVASAVEVPAATSTNLTADTAKPKAVVSARPGSSSNIRIFAITASNNKFSPSEVAAYVGDIVHLDITAVDKDYDFYQPDYGLNIFLPEGQKKFVEFQVSATDKYTFYCRSCGGPEKGPIGHVTVVSK
ncbi:MAG: cupredoxin domain-containing protein [Candidatus Liptonbacteria bacterium]|nr:cupredoxin domain-containing protein [Candidatus Liptonbacteria bacterium]